MQILQNWGKGDWLGKGFPLIVALMRRGEDDERDTGINQQQKWEVLVTSVTQFPAAVTEMTIKDQILELN